MEGPFSLIVGLTRAAFIDRHPHLFLVKRPPIAPLSGSAADAVSYETQHIAPAELIDTSVFGNGWWVGELCKRPGNPFPDRVSIGRASNCDVVLRASFISKLHAHFILAPTGEVQVRDNRSSNGTSINGRELLPGVSATVRSGDVLGVGAVKLSIVDAGALYDMLSRALP